MLVDIVVKIFTSFFMKNVIIKTVYGEEECLSFFSVSQMSLRAVWCGRQVILNTDGTVTGINPGNNTWKAV